MSGKAERTRQFIIEKASTVFNKYGYAGTSMSDLTRETGLTKGALYGNFKNKDEIAVAAFEYNYTLISDNIAEQVKLQRNSCDKLITLAEFYRDNFTKISRRGGCPILNSGTDSDDAHPLLKKCVVRALDNWLSSVAFLVRRGIKHGEIRDSSDPEQFASDFVSLIEGSLLMAKVTGKREHLDNSVERISHIVENELKV